ncbi:MAG: hypothetical protein EA374_04110 [Acholeplasmatales bacterium]|nr:MAG: hypothetical protein EA374_04110 [Acholeplasmatales bacterium]
MDSFRFAFDALAPLISLALLGYVLRRSGVLSDAFIDVLNRYIFVVALPVLVFLAMARIDDVSALSLMLLGIAVGAVTLSVVLGLVSSRVLVRSGREKPVVVQAFFRGNFVLIGIPLVTQVGGLEALAIMVILNAFLIPLTNTLSIVVFSLYQAETRLSWETMRQVLLITIKNPLMIAVGLGLLAFLVQPAWRAFTSNAPFVPNTLDMIAQTATPMALIAVGGSFRFKESKLYQRAMLVGTIGRMVVVPVLVLGPAVLWFSGVIPQAAWPALIALFASPVAVSSVAVTRGLHGDDVLAGHLVLSTTAAGLVTLFVLVALMNYGGFI